MALFPTNQNLFSIVLVIFTTSLVLVSSQTQRTVSFNITNFNTSSVALLGAAALLPNGVVSLTNPNDPNHFLSGRILYSTPVPIWDSTSGNVASFITSFKFKVVDFKEFPPGSGFVFFLVSQENANIPNNSIGGYLGIVDSQKANNQFVGVEFDTVSTWDPSYNHVGIDVNSVLSLKKAKWHRVSSELVDVNISYDNLSKTLTVVVLYPDGKFTTIAQVIDLKDVLPETVRIGFSAAFTNEARQLHHIHSWSFSSNLELPPTDSANIGSFYVI